MLIEKELMSITAVAGTPAPKLLVTEAMLVMGPVEQPLPIREVTVQVTGLAQADAKLPTFQVNVFPEKVPPHVLVKLLKQAGKGSVTTTVFSVPRFHTVRFRK